MATTTSDTQAQAASAQSTAGEQASAAPETPPTLSTDEQIAGLSLEQLQEVTSKIGQGKEDGGGVDGGAEPNPAPSAQQEAAPAEQPAFDGDDDPEQETSAQTAHRIRLNFKQAADADRKLALARLLQAEPGIDLNEAVRRIGASAQPEASNAPAAAPEARPDPAQAEIERIEARLDEIGDPYGENFDPKETRKLTGELVRAQVRLEQAQAQQVAEAEARSRTQEQSIAQARNASRESALAMCPELADDNSAQSLAFAQLYQQCAERNDPLLHSPDAPEMLALKVMRSTGYAPKAAPASAAPPSTPPASPSAPKPPARPNPNPPVTAPGSARITAPVMPSRAQAEEALASLSPEQLDAVASSLGNKIKRPAPAPGYIAA